MVELSYPNRKQVLVAGYPRSGNTVTARMLGDALNSPVTGAYNSVPLATEGLNRPGKFVVRQLHLHATDCKDYKGPAVRSGWCFCTNLWTTERVVFVLRDPRDVAVSAKFYWKSPSLLNVIKAMTTGGSPFGAVGLWLPFVEKWLSQDKPKQIIIVRFENLISKPKQEVARVLRHFDLDAVNPLNEVMRRQRFNNKKRQLARDGNTRPYGKQTQLHHLRKGVSGDWVNHFDAECAEIAYRYWRDELVKLRYEHGYDWIERYR
jgi:hypothetical protein